MDKTLITEKAGPKSCRVHPKLQIFNIPLSTDFEVIVRFL